MRSTMERKHYIAISMSVFGGKKRRFGVPQFLVERFRRMAEHQTFSIISKNKLLEKNFEEEYRKSVDGIVSEAHHVIGIIHDRYLFLIIGEKLPVILGKRCVVHAYSVPSYRSGDKSAKIIPIRL